MIRDKGVLLLFILGLNTFVSGQDFVKKIDTIVTNTDSCVYYNVIIKDEKGQILDIYEDVDCYYLTGELKKRYSSRLNGRNGVYLSYYKNGNLKESYCMINGRRIGRYIKNNEDGKPLIVGKYKTIECLNEIKVERDTTIEKYQGNIVKTIESRIKSIKEGEWKYWNSKGKLIRKEYWKKDSLLRQEKY